MQILGGSGVAELLDLEELLKSQAAMLYCAGEIPNRWVATNDAVAEMLSSLPYLSVFA
jgi:hypothetical protein